jgi:hypothetical protein
MASSVVRLGATGSTLCCCDYCRRREGVVVKGRGRSPARRLLRHPRDQGLALDWLAAEG